MEESNAPREPRAKRIAWGIQCALGLVLLALVLHNHGVGATLAGLGIATLMATLWSVAWLVNSQERPGLIQRCSAIAAIVTLVLAAPAAIFAFGGTGAVYLSVLAALTRNENSQHLGLVWLKRRLKRQGRPLSPFWEDVHDDYYWRESRRAGTEGPATELEASDAPAGGRVSASREGSCTYPPHVGAARVAARLRDAADLGTGTRTSPVG